MHMPAQTPVIDKTENTGGLLASTNVKAMDAPIPAGLQFQISEARGDLRWQSVTRSPWPCIFSSSVSRSYLR